MSKYINSFKEKFMKNNSELFGYHVTRRVNLESIQKQGLLPKTPEDYGENGDINGVLSI